MTRLEANYNDSINQSLDRVEDTKWLKLFPQCVVDPDRSSQFMTRMIYVAFSVILNRRGILGPEFFSNNYITDNMKCKTLSFQNPEATRIAQLLRQAGEAVKLGYLDELSLVVTNHEGDEEAIEVYAIKMHYFGEGGVAAQFNPSSTTQDLTPFERLSYQEYQGTKTVRDNLIWLVRSIMYLCQKVLGPLPTDFSTNFRVKYTDAAPPGYRINGFHDTSMFYKLPEDVQSATLGHLRPGYHGALVTCSSNFIDDTFAAENALKRYIEKTSERLGFGVNETIYSTISAEDPITPTNTDTTADGNGTADNLVKEMEALARPSTRRQRQPTRTSPYDKKENRSRK